MKKLISTFFFALFCISAAFAQGEFAVVTDPDGFVNVRSEPQIGKNVTDKLPTGTMIYVGNEDFENEGKPQKNSNWRKIYYNKGGVFNYEEGYIYKEPYIYTPLRAMAQAVTM